MKAVWFESTKTPKNPLNLLFNILVMHLYITLQAIGLKSVIYVRGIRNLRNQCGNCGIHFLMQLTSIEEKQNSLNDILLNVLQASLKN